MNRDELVCPVCDSVGTLRGKSWFDEEGVEAWECDECEAGWLGGWDEPPEGDPWGHRTLEEARSDWKQAQFNRPKG